MHPKTNGMYLLKVPKNWIRFVKSLNWLEKNTTRFGWTSKEDTFVDDVLLRRTLARSFQSKLHTPIVNSINMETMLLQFVGVFFRPTVCACLPNRFLYYANKFSRTIRDVFRDRMSQSQGGNFLTLTLKFCSCCFNSVYICRTNKNMAK